MARKKQAAIYPRKSRENASTLEGQINACVEWCNRNGVEYEIFREDGSASSEDWSRPKLQEMIKAVENLEFDLVVVTEQTRICRDDMFPVFKNILKETETLFVTADNNSIFNFENPDDELKSDILQAVGKNELSRTKIRLKRGTVQAAKKGDWQGKKSPMGYEYDKNTKRLRKTAEAEVIKQIFDLYLNGFSTVAIEHKFNHEGVLAHHKVKGEMVPVTWGKSTVSRVLQNITYAGHTLFGKTKMKSVKGKKVKVPNEEEFQILVKNTHEPIVSEEDWEKVQALMKSRRLTPPALKIPKHTYSGLIACANCGKHHSFERGQNGFWRVSSCQARKYNEDFTKYKMCGNSGCDIRKFEALFYLALEDIKSQVSSYKELIKQAKSSNTLEKAKDHQKEQKQLLLQKLKKKRKNILTMIEEEMYEPEEIPAKKEQTKELQNQIKDLEAEIKDLDTIKEESESESIDRVIQNIEKFLSGQKSNNKMDEREANELLSKIIEEIKYKKVGFGKPEIEVFLKQEIIEVFAGIEKATA